MHAGTRSAHEFNTAHRQVRHPHSQRATGSQKDGSFSLCLRTGTNVQITEYITRTFEYSLFVKQ